MNKLSMLVGVGLCFFSVSGYAFETLAKHALLMDANTGYVLFEKEADKPMPPASMSKLMTTYMIFDALKSGKITLDTEFVVSENAWRKGGAKSGSSTMFLNIDQHVKIRDLLRGIIVQSGNDACIVVAENMAGSEEAFAEMMTEKAVELGLKNSSFKNATGLPEKGHAMSAKDLAKLAKILINEFPEHYPIYSEKSFKFNNIEQGNRNPLLYSMSGVDGLKTGHTSEAGYGLTASGKTSDGRRLIMVINGLKSMKDRTVESKKIMNWGIMSFENKEIIKKGQIIEEIPVWLGAEKSVQAVSAQSYTITTQKGRKSEPEMTLSYDTPIQAPIKEGQKIGELKIKTDNGVKRINLIASKTVEKVGYWGKMKHILTSLIK